MKIRIAQRSDARGIARVHVDAWRAAYTGVVPETTLATLSVEDRTQFWSDNLQSGESSVLVLDHRSRVAGFVSFGPSRDLDAGPEDAEIYAIYLLPALWGGGHGRLLLKEAIETLTNRGFTLASLWVLEGNARARRFYEGFGMDANTQRQRSSQVGLPQHRYSIVLASELAAF